MKLTIEIDDECFAKAVNKEVNRAIAELAGEAIDKGFTKIMNKKIDRKLLEVLPSTIA